jgi:hypothetical protein
MSVNDRSTPSESPPKVKKLTQQEAYAAVDARDGGKCWACDKRTTTAFPPDHPLSRHRHHRLDGSHMVKDVITLCGVCYRNGGNVDGA